MNLGERIRAARNHAGLTQAQLAKAVGVTQQMIGKIETGKADGTSTLLDICIECGVSPLWLARNKGEMVPSKLPTPAPTALDREIVSVALTAVRKLALTLPLPLKEIEEEPAYASALAGALNELASPRGTPKQKLRRATERIAEAFGSSGGSDGQAADGGLDSRSGSKAGGSARKDPR